jgi:hypothetical protein
MAKNLQLSAVKSEPEHVLKLLKIPYYGSSHLHTRMYQPSWYNRKFIQLAHRANRKEI